MAKSFSSKNDWFSGSETVEKRKKSEWQKMPSVEPIFDFRAERKRSRAEPNQAENPSA